MVTGLDWQANIDATARSWSDAVLYCASLPDQGGGWRLPSRIELFSILDYTVAPSINAAAFGALPSGGAGSLFFWTASLKAGDSTLAWAVDFDANSLDLLIPRMVGTPALARCVRGP
jgi:hypothetical protein